ncbi:MAG TPA: hypothetical protein VNT27_03710 [Propionibacteriaceae bacterium]|nr:hypothetical protein [Propionibacteriaceae bacterium]
MTTADHVVQASMIGALVREYWYDAASALLDRSLDDELGGGRSRFEAASRDDPMPLARVRLLAAAARRVLDLDAEDFATIATEFQSPWARRLGESSFPPQPTGSERGALGSLVPLYELMLEVLEIRAARGEPLQVAVTAHLIGEYLPLLAWESTLGHGGDPLRLPSFLGGSKWGTDDPHCAHPSALRSTAKRALNACSGDLHGYTTYLDRFHSRLGDALAVCAVNLDTAAIGDRPEPRDLCPNPCGFVRDLPMERRRDLDARVRLAMLYVDSPIVALRHHAPVGHFFGVPSAAELSDAWGKTWDRLSRPWRDGCNPLSQPIQEGTPDAEALPGMSALVSAVAGRPIVAGRLLRTIGQDLARALVEDDEAPR